MVSGVGEERIRQVVPGLGQCFAESAGLGALLRALALGRAGAFEVPLIPSMRPVATASNDLSISKTCALPVKPTRPGVAIENFWADACRIALRFLPRRSLQTLQTNRRGQSRE